MINRFQYSYNFAFNLELRCYTTAETDEIPPTFIPGTGGSSSPHETHVDSAWI
jgi:hypothetical protein